MNVLSIPLAGKPSDENFANTVKHNDFDLLEFDASFSGEVLLDK